VSGSVPESHAIVLVGERFAPFLAVGLGMSPADFVGAVENGKFDAEPAPRHVHIGQAVGRHALADVTDAVAARGLSDRLLLRPRSRPRPVEARAVHKSHSRNVLVADFEQAEPDVFQAALRIHNDNELLLDHQSSLHVQGVLLIEAARQMFLAACELGYMRRWADRRFAYLIGSTDTRFERPVYPLPAQLVLTTQRAEVDDPRRIRFLVETRILQAGKETTVTTLECSAHPVERLRAIERRTAAATADELSRATGR
jgi:3-hydroxymyristoyl/3-hydroxydecanoyl-(acyl carrier protein) dehydratase